MLIYSSGFDGEVVSNESAVVEMRVCSFNRYIFRMKFPWALHIEIYTALRDFLATARPLLFVSYRMVVLFSRAWFSR